MSVHFITHDYNDFKLLAGRFKLEAPCRLETPDVIYSDLPYNGVGAGTALFNAWAIDYERGVVFFLSLTQSFQQQAEATDLMPSTFLTDFPQAVAVESSLLVNVS